MIKNNISQAVFAPFSAASGNLITVLTGIPTFPSSGQVAGIDMIDSAFYIIQTGTGVVAGAINVQIPIPGSAGNPVWITATTPNSATAAAFTLIPTLAASTVYMGSLNVSGSVFMPSFGVRLTVSGLSGGNITYAQLNCTMR